MKNSKKLLIIITFVLLAAVLTACSGSGEGKPHTVTFVTNEGSAIQTAVTSRIDQSPVSTRNNYQLMGWYLDEDFNTRVTFPLIVTGETVLFAKWERVYYVNYIIDNNVRYKFPYVAGSAIEIFNLAQNEYEGYIFNGWETEIPDVMPAEDVNITGSLTPKTYYICFDNTASGVTISGATTAYTTTYKNKDTVFPAIEVTYGKSFYSQFAEVKAQHGDDFDFDKWVQYEKGTGYVDFSVGRTELWEEDRNILLTPQWAETGTVGLNFELNEEGDAYIVSNYDRDGTFVRVPSQYRTTENEEYKPVIGIGNNAFNGNQTLQEIELPNTIVTIGRMAFAGMSQLRKIALPVSVTDVGDRAFEACVSLTTINIPSNVKAVSNSMFADCTSLETVTLTEGKLTKIGEYAFFGASNLRAINIPKSVITLGNFAFQNTTMLELVTFGAESPIKTIGTGTFKGSGITGIELPLVNTIAAEAFADCLRLVRISLPSSVTSIGHRVFVGATRLERVFIPSSATQIGSEIFLNCEMLSSINLGSPSKLSGWAVDWDVKYAHTPPERFTSEQLHWGAPA